MSVEEVSGGVSTTQGNRVFCPDCNALLSPSSMTKHRKTMHGVKPKRGRPVGSKNGVRLVHPGPAPRPTTRSAPAPKPITAEQITRTTAAMLWPEGVPHDMLEHLLHWNTQTEAFLATAQGRQ